MAAGEGGLVDACFGQMGWLLVGCLLLLQGFLRQAATPLPAAFAFLVSHFGLKIE
jgi:hypothetical protein